MTEQPQNTGQLLAHLARVAHTQPRVSLKTVITVVGDRAFGAVLLVVGLLLVSPLSGIPGMATMMALVVLLISLQLLIRRQRIWLPDWVLQRSAGSVHVLRAIGRFQKPARFMDRWVKPRLRILVDGPGTIAIALICMSIAVVMPFMELVPFSATSAGVPLAFFGLTLFTRDGVLTLISSALAGLFFTVINHLIL